MSDTAGNAQVSTKDESPQVSNSTKTADTQAGGTAPAGGQTHVAEEPSGYRGENPSTAGPGGTGIRSATPENAQGHIAPSAPGQTGTTPGSTPQP